MDSFISAILYYLSNAGKAVYGIFGIFGLSGEGSSAALLIIFGAFVLIIIGFWLGRARLVISIISVYAAYFVEDDFVFMPFLKSANLPEYIIKLAIFAVAFILIFFVLNRSILKSRIAAKDSSFVSIAILSLVNAGLLASVMISFFPTDGGLLPAGFFKFLGTNTARFLWAALAISVLFFMKGKREVSTISKSK